MQKGRALDVWFQHTFSNSVGTARTHRQQQPARSVTPAARISSGTSNQPTPIPAPGDGLEGTDPSGVRRVLCLLPGGADVKGEPKVPPPTLGREAGFVLLGALPLYTGEPGLRLSGELLLLLPPLSGERRCRPFTLPASAAPPPADNGGVALGGGGLPPRPPPGPVLLPTEAEGERVGLCWLPRRSW